MQKIRDQYHELKLSYVRGGNSLIDLSVINPILSPPKEIIDKLTEYILQPYSSRYTSADGLSEFKDALIHKYSNVFSVKNLTQENICMSSGISNSLFSVLTTLCGPDSSILLPKPLYTCHLNVVDNLNYKYDFYEVSNDQDRTLESILNKLAEKSYDILLLNFPNNPTGQTVDAEFYRKIKEEVSSKTTIVNDYVYAEMLKEGVANSLLYSDFSNCLELYSSSKSLSLAGWRMSSIAGDAELVSRIKNDISKTQYGPFRPFQETLAYAYRYLEQSIQENMNHYFNLSRYAVAELSTLGFKLRSDKVACFLYLELPDFVSVAPYSFCEDLLKQKGVALQPGEIFGLEGEQVIRFSLTVNQEDLERAILKIKEFLNEK